MLIPFQAPSYPTSVNCDRKDSKSRECLNTVYKLCVCEGEGDANYLKYM